jgi:hypothetical protein
LEYRDHRTYAATKDEILDAHVRIDVEWNNYNPEKSNISQTGFFFVELRGTIIRMSDIDPFYYAPKNLVANYNYQDRAIFVHPFDNCPELYSEQKGSGPVRILYVDEAEDPTKDGHLTIQAAPGYEQSLSILRDSQSKGRGSARQKPIDKELKTDIYLLMLVVPMATTLREQSDPCSRYKTTPRPEGVALSAYVNLAKWGMYGSYSWTSSKLDMGLQIRNYPGQIQFEPNGGEGNVKYRVSWSFGKIKPMIQIFRITNEGREDITDSETDILIGQKVKVEAVAVPYGDTEKGNWNIPSPVIADFKADLEEGEMLPLDDSKKLKPAVEFFFTDGSFTGKPVILTYTAYVDNKEVKGKTIFKVYEPDVKWGKNDVRESPSVTIGRWAKEDQTRLYLGEITDYRKVAGHPGMEIYSKVTFPKEFSDQPHFLQYVQLICEDIFEYKNGVYYQTGPSDCPGSSEWVLDTHYPYDGKVAEKELDLNDTPGSSLGLLTQELHQFQAFKTFLMFRPSKKATDPNSVWVPLKVAEWGWKAKAIRIRNYGSSNEPGDFRLSGIHLFPPKKLDWSGPPETYPTWKNNVSKLKACSPLPESTWERSLSFQGQSCSLGNNL